MKNTVVVDTSLVLKWILSEADSDKALALLAEWSRDKVAILAPSLLMYEAANSLHQQMKRREFPFEAAKQGLLDILDAGLNLYFSPDMALSIRAIELAGQFRLQATYDAHFLALAETKNCELWTADTRLWNSVQGKLKWVRSLNEYQHS